MPASLCAADKIAHRAAALNRQYIPAYIVLPRAEEPHGALIDAENDPQVIEQNEALAHAVRDGEKLVPFLLKLLHLPVYFPLLLFYAR
jgi:hypothetical protein